MIITDRIYGRHQVSSPAITELITSQPMQRLRSIMQGGQPKETDTRSFLFTRYDHSIGVMLLLKILGASEEEQIAGLLHDVSHTAFSHTIDSVLQLDQAEGFQDSQHEQFILKSEIPSILKKYGYNAKRIYNYRHFPLLEQPLPTLCADRVDYSFRESAKKISEMCLPELRSFNKKIVFTDKKTARVFADRFLVLQKTSWGGNEPVIREQLFTKALQYSLKKKIISLDDFWKDDNHILTKLHASKDEYLRTVFRTMGLQSFENLTEKTVIKHKKFRFVDPDVLVHAKTVRLSKIDPVFHNELKKAKKENEKGIRIPILNYEYEL